MPISPVYAQYINCMCFLLSSEPLHTPAKNLYHAAETCTPIFKGCRDVYLLIALTIQNPKEFHFVECNSSSWSSITLHEYITTLRNNLLQEATMSISIQGTLLNKIDTSTYRGHMNFRV